MNIIEKYLILAFLIMGLQGYSQNKATNVKSKNTVELSVNIINTINFQLASGFMPELGYSRYLGNYFKVGAFYQYFKSVNTFNNYGAKAGILPLPFFIKNDSFNKNWEMELSINYAYQTQQGRDTDNNWFLLKQHRFFGRLGISKRIYNNFHLLCNIDIWNRRQVFLGVRYKF